MAAQDPTAPIVKAATRPGNERPANLVPPAPSSPPGPALIPQALRQQAEDAALCGPEPPSELKMERLLTSRYGLLLTEVPSWNLVQRLRLQRQDAAAAVAKVQATLRARGRTQAAWHVGPSAPADLLPQLLELGMTPYEEPPLEAHSSCMVLMQPPEIEAPTDVVIERADTLEALAAAEAIAAAAFALRVEDRSAIQANLNTRLPLQRQNRAWLWQYVASIDDVPVGTARARFLNTGVNLNGAAVLPSARGRGVYRALVAARWREAVALGTPALTVQAGAMSRPILTKPSSALSPSPRSPSSATASNWPMTHTIPARSEHRQVVIHPGLLTERHRGSWSRPWREQDGGNAGSDAHQQSALGGRGLGRGDGRRLASGQAGPPDPTRFDEAETKTTPSSVEGVEMAVERAPDIEQMVRDARAAWKAGDLQALEPMLSHEASLLFMGSDPGEVWRGRDQVLRAAQAQRLGGDAGVESVVDEVVAYRDGEVGWSIELGRFLLGGHGAELPTRGVSVFRREQGRWRYLQSVVSVAVPDAALEPGSPLRSSHMASRQPDGS